MTAKTNPKMNLESINRYCSPMPYLEETLDDNREEVEKKKKKLRDAQQHRSSFLIGSISDINEKISQLDRKLQNYTELVIESRASDHPDEFAHLESVTERGKEIYLKREREAREINQFAGIYSMKSTFLSKPSERVKNIAKISMQQPSKTQVKKETGKPKFVELHQYPGYDPGQLTPLPNCTSAVYILSKTAGAQKRSKKQGHYKEEFDRLFYSQMSQAVLQDVFWWIFLEKWQASKATQEKMFNRVAHNYVKLLTYSKGPQYRESFQKNYSSLLSQSVYSAFCESFPDSYRQFNDVFKDDLINLIYQWTVGLRPSPRTWMGWNLMKLEPPGMKMPDDLIQQSSNKTNSKSSSLNLDLPDFKQLENSQSVGNPSCSSFSVHSHSSATTSDHIKPKESGQSLVSQNSSTTSIGVAINEVANAQKDMGNTNDVGGNALGKKHNASSLNSRSKIWGGNNPTDLLSTISEKQEEEDSRAVTSFSQAIVISPEVKDSRSTMPTTKSSTSLKRQNKLRESHPVGEGAKFTHCVFDMCGNSPLVAHFLKMKKLQTDAGLHVRVQRTEIASLPPLKSRTYRDVIGESRKCVKDISRKHQHLVERNQRDTAHFIKTQKANSKELDRREAALLAKPREVKRLSDLIMLELKKDQDSVSAGATAALEAALEAQD